MEGGEMSRLAMAHLKAQQGRPGATGDELQQFAFFFICESFDYLPKDLDDRVIGRVPT